MASKNNELVWLKVLAKEELYEGRVVSVTCENRTLCMSRRMGVYGALENKRPPQERPPG